jgi:hypothetical protein
MRFYKLRVQVSRIFLEKIREKSKTHICSKKSTHSSRNKKNTNSTVKVTNVLQHSIAVVVMFMELIMLFAWSIWTTRNDFIFKGAPPKLVFIGVGKKFKDEARKENS